MRYPGDSHYWFGHEEEFSRRLQMTVEAWVYREDSTWTESVLSHGSISEGFFFGFASEKIRFGRSGGFAVLSEGDVLKVMVVSQDPDKGRIALSTKRLEPEPGDMLKDPKKVYDNAEKTAEAFRAQLAAEEAELMGASDDE